MHVPFLAICHRNKFLNFFELLDFRSSVRSPDAKRTLISPWIWLKSKDTRNLQKMVELNFFDDCENLYMDVK